MKRPVYVFRKGRVSPHTQGQRFHGNKSNLWRSQPAYSLSTRRNERTKNPDGSRFRSTWRTKYAAWVRRERAKRSGMRA